MIELFLDNEKYDMFVKGTYNGHELKCLLHVGSFQDSCVIYCPDLPELPFVCRYFLYSYGIRFYGRRTVEAEIVVHNIGQSDFGIGHLGEIEVVPCGIWRERDVGQP